MPASAYAKGFQIFNRLNHPWVALVDQNKFNVALEEIRILEPKIIGNCHSPLALGRTESHLRAMAEVPVMDGPMPLPDQAALEAILTQIQGSGSHWSGPELSSGRSRLAQVLNELGYNSEMNSAIA